MNSRYATDGGPTPGGPNPILHTPHYSSTTHRRAMSAAMTDVMAATASDAVSGAGSRRA